MRALELPKGSPREWGRAHGESFRGEIQSLADIRIHLTRKLGRFPDADTVLRVANDHLPILERYDRDLHDELVGIADGAALSPAHVVVVNHYTDLRDIDPDEGASGPPAPDAGPRDAPESGCSIVYARTDDGPVLAQTWDMHATALPYTMMLRVPETATAPEAWLLTITGCLGMSGLTSLGLAVAINNLHSTDARTGVVWPAVVRRALREPSAAAARDAILASPLGSGHHYLVADDSGAFGVETSGTQREVVYRGDEPQYVHTNHCLDDRVAAASRIPTGSTSHDRYRALEEDVRDRPVASALDAWRRLGSHEGYPRSVCTNMATPENPHGAATCAGISMDLGRRIAWAQGGFIHNVAPEGFAFTGDDGDEEMA